MLYTVFSIDTRIGKYDSLEKAKLACLNDFEKSKKNISHYEIKVFNPKKNKVTKTHYARCSYLRLAETKFRTINLDYGK